MSKNTIYFGYGSNLWLDQMKRRCPESKYLGVASLQNWKWIITTRGYANIIPSYGDVVYGLMYELTPEDEHSLDIYEGSAYQKQTHSVKWVKQLQDSGEKQANCLIYIDVDHKSESTPRKEYIYRMNMGIADAIQEGVPSEYIDKYLRVFIPAPDNQSLRDDD
ncbi:hypothetical protein D9613_002641 [Agrocybe pediades]|uniref:gamma-glutamylcyclotransferase n=1 Tax=Agrocybe pediades TaxID=84607 RepID=A0A8H4QRF7_9AGAR|nr:hypothetical protein D9613_002641 [Agrocybe pediades]